MGLAFYLRSVAVISCLALLICLTWYKVTELVQEFSSGSIIHSHLKSMMPFEDKKHGGQGDESYHVAYLKVHKTGSSSVQNIFLRFGQSRNLTFILAHDNVQLAETKYPNMISYTNTLTDQNIVPPPEGRHFDLLCCHVIYNRTQFEKYLPNDTKYIGLVRDPITRLESAIRYFNMFPDMELSTYAKDPLRFERGPHSMSNNRMAFEFGYPLNLFPNSKEQPDDLETVIKEYTNKLLGEFALILINERMDESLVLMKRVLNWHVKDILYMKLLVAKKETRRFTDTDIRNLKSFLYLDFYLYQIALDVFSAKVMSLGEDFQKEVERYQEDKAKVNEFCQKSLNSSVQFEDTKWDTAFSVTRADCKLFTYGEIPYIQNIRLQQYGRLDL